MDPALPQQPYQQQPQQGQQYISLSPDPSSYQTPYQQPVQQPGYAPQNVNNAPMYPPQMPPAKRSGKRLMLFIVLLIILVGTGVGAWFMMQKNTQNPSEVPITPTPGVDSPTPVASESARIFVDDPMQHMLIAYVEKAMKETGVVDELTIYDPEEDEPVATYTTEASGSAALSVFPWSPDGERLPVFIHSESEKTVKLMWFETEKLLFTEPVEIDPKYESSLFASGTSDILPWWPDTQTLAVYLGESTEKGIMTVLYAGTDGSFAEKDIPLMQTLRNSTLVVEHGYMVDEDVVGTTVAIQTGDTQISHITPPGNTTRFIGLNADSVLVLTEQIASASSTYAIDFIDPVTGTVKNTFPLSMEGWKLAGAQMLYDKRTVVVHQIDNPASPSIERFLAYDTVSRRPKLIVSQVLTPESNGYEVSLQKTGQSFLTTADGQWVVVLNANRSAAGVFSVQLHHMDRNDSVDLCTSCTDISVYNPLVVYGREIWSLR